MAEYIFAQVNGHEWHDVLDPLYRAHYAEMQDRMERDGMPIPDYNPRLDTYFAAMDRGDYLSFVVLCNDAVVGYCGVWVTQSMHNHERIATEDAIYVVPDHRNGVGRRLVKFILERLRKQGVRRVMITPVTDLRVAKIWERMGFVPTAQLLTYTFPEAA